MHSHFPGLNQIHQNCDHYSTLNKIYRDIGCISPSLNEHSIHRTQSFTNMWALRGPNYSNYGLDHQCRPKRERGRELSSREHHKMWVPPSCVHPPPTSQSYPRGKIVSIERGNSPRPTSMRFHSNLASILYQIHTEYPKWLPKSDVSIGMLHR